MFILSFLFALQSLASIEKDIQELSYLNHKIPWLLEEGADYDVNFLKIIQMSQSLKEELVNNAIPHKNDETLISLEASEKSKNEIFLIASELIQFRMKDLGVSTGTEVQRFLNDISEIKENLEKQLFIKEAVTSLGEKSFTTGIITMFRQANIQIDMKSFLKEGVPQFKYLFKAFNISKSDFAENFQGFEKLRLSQVDKLDAKALKVFYENLQRYSHVSFLIHWTKSLLDRELIQLNSTTKSIFSLETLTALNNIIPTDSKLVLNEQGKNESTNLIRKLNKQNGKTIKFRLEEQDLSVGVFRGICGSDCATKFSWPMVFAPKEKLFFIYQNSSLKGYLQWTEVEVGEKPYIYLHDITGSRLSIDLMQEVLEVMPKFAQELGFSGVLLPTWPSIHRNNNFELLRNHLRSFVKGKPSVAINYYKKDRIFRYYVLEGLEYENKDIHYDLPSENLEAHELSLSSNLEIDIQKKKKQENNYELDKKDQIWLVLDMAYPARNSNSNKELTRLYNFAGRHGSASTKHRVAVAQDIANYFKIDIESTKIFDTSFWENYNRLSQKDYLASITNAVSPYHEEVNPRYLIKHKLKFIAEGLVNSKDAFSDGIAETDRALTNIYERWPYSQQIERSLSKILPHWDKLPHFRQAVTDSMYDLTNYHRFLFFVNQLHRNGFSLPVELYLDKETFAKWKNIELVSSQFLELLKDRVSKSKAAQCSRVL